MLGREWGYDGGQSRQGACSYTADILRGRQTPRKTKPHTHVKSTQQILQGRENRVLQDSKTKGPNLERRQQGTSPRKCVLQSQGGAGVALLLALSEEHEKNMFQVEE